MIANSDIVWVQDHLCLLNAYLRKKYKSFDDRDYFRSVLLDYNNAYATRTLLEDFRKTNEEKINYFLSKFFTQSLIVTVVADRGQGKTAFVVFVLEELAKVGKQVYALYPFPKLPFLNIVYDLSEVPNGAVLLIDEIGQRYPARGFQNDEALALTTELIQLRHRGISIIGCVQNLRLVDLNYVDFSDVIVWKYYNLQGVTRQDYITDMVTQLMPSKGDINSVLVVDRGEYSTFSFPFSEFSYDISTYLQDTKDQKWEIVEHLKKYYDKREIKKILLTKYNIRLSLDEVKELEG